MKLKKYVAFSLTLAIAAASAFTCMADETEAEYNNNVKKMNKKK